MNTPLRRHHRESALTRFELVVILVAVGLLLFVSLKVASEYWRMMRSAKFVDQLTDGQEIYLSLRAYAADEGHDGEFPTFRDPVSKTGQFANSNEALAALMPAHANDKRAYLNPRSAWCRKTPTQDGAESELLPGENDWCYVRGLRVDSPEQWPILANAFAPGTLHYVSDPKQPGGVWKGAHAVVIRVDGSAHIVGTEKAGDTYFIPRRDKPTANAFAKDGEWLAGEHVEVLYPLPPPATK